MNENIVVSKSYICMIMVSFCCEIKRIYKISLQEGCKTDSIMRKSYSGQEVYGAYRSPEQQV